MSSMSEDIQCAVSDTRPPMLDRTDFDILATLSDVIAAETEGAFQQGPVRARVLNDLSAEEKERYKADIRATNILLQGRMLQFQQYPTQSSKSPKPELNHLLLTTFQLDSRKTSSNARNKATVQDGRVVVQDVRGRYNANNQGRPFQRNNARGNVVAGNAGGQNRGGIINPGQAKPISATTGTD
ncbi:hypothetical protein Tco_0899459 [Tanacetum coccineum]